MAAFLDVCRFIPTLGGTTDWTVSSAATGYQTPASAGAVNGTVYRYRAESSDLTQWEVGYGAYTVSGTVLARTTVLFNSLGTTAKINFTAVPQVAVVALKEDLISIEEANSFTTAQQKQARSNIGAADTNVLINSDFRINQRAYVSASVALAGGYLHDRWKAGAGGGDYSFTQLAGSTQITIAASKTLIQIVEDKNVVGGTYVLSWTGTCQARYAINSATPAGAYANSPIVIAGQTAGTTMSVEFGNGAASGTLGTVKLETGSVATLFVPRDYGQELATCMRYFCPLIRGNSVYFGPFACYSTTQAFGGFLPYPVPMRASPTITVSSPSHFALTTAASTNTSACTTVSISDIGTQMAARLGTAAVPSGLVAGNATDLVTISASASVLLEAEL